MDTNIKTRWSDKEKDCIKKYFATSLQPFTLYQRLIKINPNRSYEAMMRKLRYMKDEGYEQGKYIAQNKLRIGYLDIETTNLKGNIGHMLSWYIKKRDKNEYDFSVITKKEIFDEVFDKRLVVELLNAFKNYDILYTHYGADWRFDIPFIRTRAYAHGLEDHLPEEMQIFIRDTFPIAKKKLRLSNNRLGTIAQALGIKNIKKTNFDTDIWNLARVGNKKAIDNIALHNKRDVQLLERVQKKLEPIERKIMSSI